MLLKLLSRPAFLQFVFCIIVSQHSFDLVWCFPEKVTAAIPDSPMFSPQNLLKMFLML